MTYISGKILRDAIISGANNMQNHRSDVDELNVFPVPDGDTGTNMSMTISAAAKELKTLDNDISVEKAAGVAAAAMLRGARGNSGVILSLLFRGFSRVLIGQKEMDATGLCAALSGGVAAAYKAVMKPTEGTMLTVARVVSEKISNSSTQDMAELFRIICETAGTALDETPEQLPVLKKAGVVDAGGKGLVHIFDGMRQVVEGGKICPLRQKETKAQSTSAGKGVFADVLSEEDCDFGYCTEFLINKNEKASAEKLRAYLESMGDSVVVVEDDDIIKSHVHCEDPGRILSHAIIHGTLSNIKIENMSEQFQNRKKQGKGLAKQAKAEQTAGGEEFIYAAVEPDRSYGFVSVAAGNGLKDLFIELGCDAVVQGGQTNNPSTDDILKAAQSIPAKTVFVLPNNKNIILAAEQAKKMADRKIVVLPTRTIPQGITAMLNFDEYDDVEKNTVNMNKATDRVSTGQITFAARDSEFDGYKIKKNEILALENGKLAFTENDVKRAVQRLVKSMVKRHSSFVTLIAGEDIDTEDAEQLFSVVSAKLSKGIEASLIIGGQPVYYYIISVE